MSINFQSKHGKHDCKSYDHSIDGWCNIKKKWAFMLGNKECKK